MSSALINRMVHVHLNPSPKDWLEWAGSNDIHPLVLEYIQVRPDHLWSLPPKHEESFSSPRSWHILSDALKEYGEAIKDDQLEILACGCLTPHHASQFKAFIKQVRGKYQLKAIITGDMRWPRSPEDRDLLYFLSQSLRGQLIKELPKDRNLLTGHQKELTHVSKALIHELAQISLEIAQMVVAEQEGETLPEWFMVDIVRDLPRLVDRKSGP